MVKILEYGSNRSDRKRRTASMAVAKSLFLTAFFLGAITESGGQVGSQLWGTKFETIVGGGYDSNINGTRERGTEDGFVEATQTFELSRLNSLTMFNVAGNISRTQFFNERDVSFSDGGLEIEAGFPRESAEISSWNAKAFVNRINRIDFDQGRRLQPTVSGFLVAGDWLYSPKSGFSGSVKTTNYDRSRDKLSSSESIHLTTGFIHSGRPEQRWSAEYGLELADSDAGSESTHHTVGFRRRGNLSTKVYTNSFFGVRFSDFTGFENFSDTGPAIAADLTWVSSPLFDMKLGLKSVYDFTATGFAVLNNQAHLGLNRDLGKGFHLTGNLTVGESDYERNSDNRSDRYWIVGGDLEYAFTQRFFVRLSANIVDSDSNLTGFDLKHNIFSILSGIKY